MTYSDGTGSCKFSVTLDDKNQYVARVWDNGKYHHNTIVEKYSCTDWAYGVYFTSKETGEVVFENAYRNDLIENAVTNAHYNNTYFENNSFVAKVKNVYQL